MHNSDEVGHERENVTTTMQGSTFCFYSSHLSFILVKTPLTNA